MATFSEMIDRARAGGEIEIDDSWRQGRAVFGGLATAITLEAAARELAGDVPLRSVMTSFVAPLGDGPLSVTASLLRAGRAVSQVEGKLVQDGQVLTAVQAAFGAGRPVSRDYAAGPMDDAPPVDSLNDMPFAEGLMPGFLQHFQVRWVTTPVGIQSASDRAAMWVRLRDDGIKAYPNAWLIAVADMPPPVMMLHYEKPVRASSLSWSLEFFVPPQDVKSDWFFLDYRLESAADGYSQQSGRIFDETGQLIAYSRQCMVYFEPSA